MKQPVLSKVKNMARRLDVAPITLYRKIREGTLPHIRVGTEIRLDEAECIAHFRQKVKKSS